MKPVQIGTKIIGDGHPCFIIAEAGSNHNGSLEIAYQLVDAATEAGADAVKFQHFKAEKIYPPNCGDAQHLGYRDNIFDIMKMNEMPDFWIPKLAAYCQRKGILFFSSTFDEESADMLDPYVNFFKIASYEATHIPLLRHIARKGKPIILSVGVTTVEEIKEAIETIRKEGNNQIVLQHCVADYPAPCKDYNLRTIHWLKELFDIPVGVSDHTFDNAADFAKNPFVIPISAVALGANTIEKHFTTDRNLPGPDHRFALTPDQLKLLVLSVRDAEAARGVPYKLIAQSEMPRFAYGRRTVFAVKDIAPGELLTRQNTRILRQGTHPPGLAPRDYELALGKRVRHAIHAYTTITNQDIEQEEPNE